MLMKLLGFPLAKAEDITQTILVNLGLNLAEKKVPVPVSGDSMIVSVYITGTS